VTDTASVPAQQAWLDGVTAAFYNAFFTAGPVLCFALFDRPVRHLSTLMRYPQLYNRKRPLTSRTFWKTGVLTAITHAAVSNRCAHMTCA
jgi:phospholipid-transporting ATPase